MRDTRGDTRVRTRARKDTKVRTGTRGIQRRIYVRARTRAKESTRARVTPRANPQNHFVAPAQANQAAAAAAATLAQAGPPYEFRGRGPALQAAALAAAAAGAAATPAAAQSADVREWGAQKGVGKGQKGKIPVTPQKRVGWTDWSVGAANRDWENWGEDQGPRPPRPGVPQGHAT